MAKGIAEINVSDSDELRLKKINENFKAIITGAAPVGAISGQGGGYNMLTTRVGSSLANNTSFAGSLGTNSYFADTLSTYMIDSRYITADKIGVGDLSAEYAQIDLANIRNLNVQDFYAKIGLIDQATIQDGWVTGTLSAVKINAANLMAGTITADKIKFSDGSEWSSASDFVAHNEGLLAALNALALGGSDQLIAKLEEAGTSLKEQMQIYDSQLDGSIIMADTIVADKIKVSDLQAFHATIGGFSITDEGLLGNLSPKGLIEFRNDGYFRAGSNETFIVVDPDQDELAIHCTSTAIDEDLTIADHWKWDYSSSDGALNLMYIGV